MTAVRFTIANCLLLLAITASAQTSERTCAMCHGDVTGEFERSVHGGVTHDVPQPCGACHGATAEHVAAPRKGNILNPAKTQSVEEANARCLSCHRGLKPHSRWIGSAHQRAGLSCASCHVLHGQEEQPSHGTTAIPALLRNSTEAETCFLCHGSLRHAQLQRSTHLFPDDRRQTRFQCSTCHDAHGGSGGKLLRAMTINETCYSCHDEKRGPFLWEHPPVRQNCLTCHAAHGSNNLHLLTMRLPVLCQSCHVGDPHQTLVPQASSAWLVNRACTNCHQLIHGSNHPSGITLQR